ncbi:MAG: hypothetical protein AAB398_01295 [Pseudomonadota bacterium]
MNVLFGSPLGTLLAKPWVDWVGLYGLRRWYLPLSRLWAAANAAGEDAGRFRNEIGAPLPAFWLASRLRPLLSHNDRVRLEAEGARRTWETAIFGEAAADPRSRPARSASASGGDPPSGDSRMVLSAAVSAPRTLGTLADRST